MLTRKSALIAALGTAGFGYATGSAHAATPNRREIDAADFGVKADLRTDDTDAIEAAIRAATIPARQYDPSWGYPVSWRVTLPAGLIRISRTLILPYGMTLVGAGRHSTLLLATSGFSGTSFIRNDGAAVQVRDLGILNYFPEIDGIDLSSPAGYSLTEDSLHVVENVLVRGGARSYVIAGTECRITNCVAHLASRESLDVQGGDHVISGFTSGASLYRGDTIKLSSANVRVVNSKVYGAAGNALNASGGGRHQIAVFEAQDCAGGITLGSDVVANGLTVDSCCDGIWSSSALTISSGRMKAEGMILVRPGGKYQTPCAFSRRSALFTPQQIDFMVSGVGRLWQQGPFPGAAVTINGERVELPQS